jgi:hypothetical protein
MAGYLVALDGVSAQALKLTAMAIIQGEIEEMSTKVCPTPPELSRAVRKRMAEDRRKELASTTTTIEAQPVREARTGYCTLLNLEYQAWHNGSPPGPLMLQAWEKHFGSQRPQYHAGRKLLCGVPSLARAQEMAKSGAVPPGSLYVARYGAFYGPPPPERNDNDDGFSEPQSTGRAVGADWLAENANGTSEESPTDADHDDRAFGEDYGAAEPVEG